MSEIKQSLRKCFSCSQPAEVEAVLLCSKCYSQKVEKKVGERQVTLERTLIEATKRLEREVGGNLRRFNESQISQVSKINHQHRLSQLEAEIGHLKEDIKNQKEQFSAFQEKLQRLQELSKQMQGDSEKNEAEQSEYLYTLALKKKNCLLQEKVNKYYEGKMKELLKLMKILRFEDKKFIVQKYVKIKKNENVMYPSEQYLQTGHPFIVVENQQYIEIEVDVEDKSEREEIEMKIINIIYESVKVMMMIKSIFLAALKLPYKTIVTEEGIFIENYSVLRKEFSQKSYEKIWCEDFKKFISRIQANVQYLAWAIGYKSRPLLLLDEQYLKKIQQNGFSVKGEKQKKWRSKLRELHLTEIEREEKKRQNFKETRFEKEEVDEDDEMEEIGNLKMRQIRSEEKSQGEFEIVQSLKDSNSNPKADDGGDHDSSFQILE